MGKNNTKRKTYQTTLQQDLLNKHNKKECICIWTSQRYRTPLLNQTKEMEMLVGTINRWRSKDANGIAAVCKLSLNNNKYKKSKRYAKQVSYRRMKRAVDFLKENGYIAYTKGFYDKEEKIQGQSTEYIPTAKGCEYIDSLIEVYKSNRTPKQQRKDNQKIRQDCRSDLITLKDASGSCVEYEDNEYTNQIRKELQFVNEHLAKQDWRDHEGNVYPIDERTGHIVYNIDFTINGRCYSGFSRLSNKEGNRDKHIIANQKMVYKDAHSSLPRALYKLCDKPAFDVNGDVYDVAQEFILELAEIPDADINLARCRRRLEEMSPEQKKDFRELVKKVWMLATNMEKKDGTINLNGKISNGETFKGTLTDYNPEDPESKPDRVWKALMSLEDAGIDLIGALGTNGIKTYIWKALQRKHPDIADKFNSDKLLGNRLCNIEARWMLRWCYLMAKAGLTFSSPIFDGIYIAERDLDAAGKLLRQALKELELTDYVVIKGMTDVVVPEVVYSSVDTPLFNSFYLSSLKNVGKGVEAGKEPAERMYTKNACKLIEGLRAEGGEKPPDRGVFQ